MDFEELTALDALTTVFILFVPPSCFLCSVVLPFLVRVSLRVKNSLTLFAEGITDFCLGCLAFLWEDTPSCFAPGEERWWKALFLVETRVTSARDSRVCLLALPRHVLHGHHHHCLGALAERIKYSSYLVLSVGVCLFVYPIVGTWTWGGGWLAEMAFIDLAGSTQVHVVGGVIALMGCLFLGPRKKGTVPTVDCASFPATLCRWL